MNKKRLAARILKVGESKIWFDPDKKKEIEEAITAADFRVLIKKGTVKKLPEKKNLSARRGGIQSTGKRKGAKYSILDKKRRWIIKIRSLRVELKNLEEGGKIEKSIYKSLYRKAGGGFFRNKSHLKTYIERNELFKK
ncbi:MAG: 50S ribosomal protein L19e [Candidatus Aenigmarchaeota archaeon]|nr:50S ribosomal protein L19e [Candidatus Aenigmarchaeota archaeon]